MGATATRITAERYYEITVEGDRKQLVDGRIVVTEPKAIHGVLQWRLALAIGSWVDAGEGRGLGSMPTDVRMDDYNVYGPDVLWFSQQGLSAAFPSGLDAYPDRVPDLCVEIRSASTWRYDVGTKKRVYESGGLPELWLVDHVAETVLVYRRTEPGTPTFDVALELGKSDTLSSPQLPGLSLSHAELFRQP